MEYLARDGAPFSSELWNSIDDAVVKAASSVLTGRRFLALHGPVGGGVQFAKIDRKGRQEDFGDGFVKTTNRQVVEVPQLFSDFWLYWRDLEAANKNGCAPDLAAAMFASQSVALHEDKMIYYGLPELGLDGLLTVKNSISIKRSDWSTGEGSFIDVATGLAKLEQNNYLGRYALILSTDLYVQLQRIQPGTGLMEIDRIKALLDKRIYKSTILKPGSALLVCAEPYCMDLLIGQDMAAAYLELVDLNHHLRIMETALLRVKCPDAIVVFK